MCNIYIKMIKEYYRCKEVRYFKSSSKIILMHKKINLLFLG